MKKENNIIIISGPSGTGKGSLIKEFIKNNPSYKLSISATTRPPRANEKDGIDYHFISKKKFNEKIKSEEFIEYCLVHHHFYGTLKEEVTKHTNTIIEIDVQGAKKIKKTNINAYFIFIAPPSINILKERLKKRKTETEQSIAKRIGNAKKELLEIKQYNIVIINDKIEKASDELTKSIKNIEKKQNKDSKEKKFMVR